MKIVHAVVVFFILFCFVLFQVLTVHNRQKRKSGFLIWNCYTMYTLKAVGQLIPNCAFKSEIWVNFLKIWYFVNIKLIKIKSKEPFCTCVTRIIFDYLPKNPFLLINFQCYMNLPFQFRVFTVKNHLTLLIDRLHKKRQTNKQITLLKGKNC